MKRGQRGLLLYFHTPVRIIPIILAPSKATATV